MVALSATHLGLAGVFFRLSRGSWIPVPLCGANALLSVWYLATAAFHLDGKREWFWVASAANRVFDAEILYLVGTAAYRRAFIKSSP